MSSRRHVRESAVQFLYCADLEGGAAPATLREPFWNFITASDRRALQVATIRTIHHLAEGRSGRIVEFVDRAKQAEPFIAAWPEASSTLESLRKIQVLESSWSTAFGALARIPHDQDDEMVADHITTLLDQFLRIDRDLCEERKRFLEGAADLPRLRSHLEALVATIRRLQRVSDRLRMVESPELFPENADLAKLRRSREDLLALRERSDALVDAILIHKAEIDERLASKVENFSPERIDPVDRAILRLGTYELIHTKTPPKVAINESIELAKRFGTTDSGRFVNGILDAVARDLAADANPA